MTGYIVECKVCGDLEGERCKFAFIDKHLLTIDGVVERLERDIAKLTKIVETSESEEVKESWHSGWAVGRLDGFEDALKLIKNMLEYIVNIKWSIKDDSQWLTKSS